VSAKVRAGGTETSITVDFELEVVKRFQYALQFQTKKPTEVRWSLVESNFFKTNSGVWSLKSLGAVRTSVHYELDVSFGFLVPGWITKKLTETSLPKMFDSFETQAGKVSL